MITPVHIARAMAVLRPVSSSPHRIAASTLAPRTGPRLSSRTSGPWAVRAPDRPRCHSAPRHMTDKKLSQTDRNAGSARAGSD
ncbi:hypothetical protein GCM10018783_20630 [Streptomyces griseosporeus]|nr:hypothetical protein GCM10018783_20630 [Streptomyces griseosporeus]